MWLASAPDLYYPPTAQVGHRDMKSIRHHFISIFTIYVMCISSSLFGQEASSEYDCASAKQYYQAAISAPDASNLARSVDYKGLL